MFKISILVAAVAGLMVLPCSASAEDKDKKMPEEEIRGPKEAKTTAEIVKAVEDIHVKMAIGGKPDEVSTAEFRGRNIGIGGPKVFVAWHSPFSGLPGCCAYLYVLDEEKNVWTRQMSKTFRNTNDLSVEFSGKSGGKVTLRATSGKNVYKFKLYNE